jgi:mannose-1-phosphate guanylyltransferase
VIGADIGWKDVGSWDALEQCFSPDKEGNLFLTQDFINIDSSGITLDSDALMVACVGVKDLVIVSSQGAILICAKERAQDVKKVVEELKRKGRDSLI